MKGAREKAAVSLLSSAVWRGETTAADDAELQDALALARRNHVEGRLARAYPQQLEPMLTEVGLASELLLRNLSQVGGRLQRAGVPAVLIKAGPADECVRTDFDVVVDEHQWQPALAALAGWYVHISRYWLERSSKAHLYPPVGPALHLHTGVSWFGVPVVPTGRLVARAAGEGGWLVPAPADSLRIWLAHAVFQNLSLDLSELLAVRGLLRPGVVAAAREESSREGWRVAFGNALEAARAAARRLDRGACGALPVPLPVSVSLRAGAEHAHYLLGCGRRTVAAREAALRLPLVIAKRRHALTG